MPTSGHDCGRDGHGDRPVRAQQKVKWDRAQRAGGPGRDGTWPQPNQTESTCAACRRRLATGAAAQPAGGSPCSRLPGALALDEVEHLARGSRGRSCGRLVDGERGLDAEARRVAIVSRPRRTHSSKMRSVTLRVSGVFVDLVAHQLDRQEQPEPRTCRRTGSDRRRARARASMIAPTRRAFSTRPSSSRIAQRRRARRGRERVAAVARRRPDGFDHGLAPAIASVVDERRTAGSRRRTPCRSSRCRATTPVWWTPQHVPVRPKPVIISSAMNSAPSLVGDRLDRGQELVGRDDVARGALHRLDDDAGDRAGGRDLDLLARDLGARDAARRVARAERAAVAVGVRHDGASPAPSARGRP